MAKFASARFASALFVVAVAAVLSMAFLSSCGSTPDEGNLDSSTQIEVTIAVAANEDKSIVEREEAVVVFEGASVLDATNSSSFEAQVEKSEYGSYVSSLLGVAAEGSSGWVYTLNGEAVMDSAESCILSEGDRIEWSYMSW